MVAARLGRMHPARELAPATTPPIGTPRPHVGHDRRERLIEVQTLINQIPQRHPQREDPLIKSQPRSLRLLFLLLGGLGRPGFAPAATGTQRRLLLPLSLPTPHPAVGE